MLRLPLDNTAFLAALEPWQADEFAEFTTHNREFLAPWLPWATRITDATSAREFLTRYADRQAADDGRIFGIWSQDGAEPARLVGGTLFRTFSAKAGTAEIGVWLSPGHTGRGLVTKAAGHMIDWAVTVRGMSRVEWMCTPENTASQAVAARLGMTHEGTLRESFPLNGKRVDVQVWAILADEWHDRPTL
ncbi:RimJ/RimL family protein N-acetyltransferase [Stackebrandtia endophytica]|uniref:RimJ/RimL family protein N-acetyltransferase n=1 Tax=Stackebrandtia endophytica TaxID=1496996 RepID=A0A543AT10_9ACTN|nr:GNAT family protein [Stackebrandtia endophytica]TQL75645.1 RimJ/RimL family protein N-acetyltransferase [Stackebrandtia endophytica]